MPYRKPLTDEQKKRHQYTNKLLRKKNAKYYKEYSRLFYLKNKEKIRKVQKKYISLPETKEKKRIYDIKYREKNLVYMSAWHKAHNKKNAVAISKQKQDYYLRNKAHIIKRTMAYANKLSKANTKQGINFRIVRACRTRVWNLVKGNFKSASTMELVGCTGDELRKYLESKFEPWMTWENYGKWDIDHIIPCSKFNMICPVQQHACFHYSNLQPLEHIANIKKRDKII